MLGCSGYDSHLRQLANALNKFTKVRLSVNLSNGWERLVNDKELEMIKRKPEEGEITLLVTLPHTWKIYKGKRNWGYCIWEGDRVPESFIKDFLDSDIEYIIVPSNHTKQAIINTTDNQEIIKKIKVISHGVDLDKFYPKEKEKRCIFVANKGFRNLEDRGGIQYLIRAYIEEFNVHENVELILKINPAYGVPNLLQMFPELKGQIPKIAFIPDFISFDKLVEIYNKGTIFVSPTRAEAFNLPCLEAMACGLPVITTNYGGQTDYVNDENGWIISGELKEVENELMYEGINWLTPSIKELRKVLRECYKNPDKVAIKGKKALDKARELTWDNSAKILVELDGSNLRS